MMLTSWIQFILKVGLSPGKHARRDTDSARNVAFFNGTSMKTADILQHKKSYDNGNDNEPRIRANCVSRCTAKLVFSAKICLDVTVCS